MAQKKVSAALMPVICASWSITTTLISASAGNVRCWPWPGPRFIPVHTGAWIRPCGSWRGSMLSTRWIPAAAAAGWWTAWPGKGSRSAATGRETSCAAWVYGRSTKNPHDRSGGSLRALSVPGGVSTITAVDQVWATDITYIPLQKGFLYLVAIVDLFSRNVLS